VAHAFNPSTWEAEADGFLSSRPAWSTEWVPGQPGLHRETLSQKKKKKANHFHGSVSKASWFLNVVEWKLGHSGNQRNTKLLILTNCSINRAWTDPLDRWWFRTQRKLAVSLSETRRANQGQEPPQSKRMPTSRHFGDCEWYLVWIGFAEVEGDSLSSVQAAAQLCPTHGDRQWYMAGHCAYLSSRVIKCWTAPLPCL
jgi:hypothetical protein